MTRERERDEPATGESRSHFWLVGSRLLRYPDFVPGAGGHMPAEIFTDDWARLWCEQINLNESYKKAATRWEGDIGLIMSPDPDMGIAEERIVVADLWHGDCRGARAYQAADLDEVPYLIKATPAVWKNVLGGETDPIVGLMGGKLKLAKGKLFALLPYAKAAKELVASAIRVDTTFPAGW
jgi:putative sterol carrier protein